MNVTLSASTLSASGADPVQAQCEGELLNGELIDLDVAAHVYWQFLTL
jgi:hypothetical protein